MKYGYPAGAIGDAMVQLSMDWGLNVPPLNSIIVNAKNGMPGNGVDYYLKKYFNVKKGAGSYSAKQRRAIIEEIHADVFAFKQWNRVLKACAVAKVTLSSKKPSKLNMPPLVKGGWSREPESEAHKKLKQYVASHPSCVGLPASAAKGRIEYQFPSADCADVVFITAADIVGVEVKSRISSVADLTRGLFQAIKYQALLRAEQRARLKPPTATAVLVSEAPLPDKLHNLANILGIGVFIVSVK